MMTERSAFVTGGTGFLGRHLLEQLTARGWRVIALQRPTSDRAELERLPVRWVAGDLLDLPSLQRVLPHGLDAVFHLAADTSMWSVRAARQTAVNVEGTRNIVAASLRAGAGRLIHVSTWTTYGLEQGEITEEFEQQGGRSWINYNRSKFQGEEAVRAGVRRGLDAVIVNPAHIIGRYDRHGWARLIIAAHERWLPGVPPGAGSFCHAEGVARALIAAEEDGRSGHNYLLSGADATLVELFRAINQVTGSRVPLRPLPGWLFRGPARASAALARLTGREPELTPEGAAMVLVRARVTSRKAERELGYRPTALGVMIEDSYRWLKDQELLLDSKSRLG